MRSILLGTLLALTLAPNPLAQNREIELPWLRTAGATAEGVAADDRAGWAVSGAGDFNGDGFGDLIIGAPENFLGVGDVKGNAYIVLGSATISGAIDLAAADVVMTGAANDDEAGYSVSGAGDVNGDGIDDVIVGAWHADANGSNSGRAYIVYGSATPAAALDLGAIPSGAGVTINGKATSDLAGVSVSGAGDVNGDGYDDVIIGASGATPVVNLEGEAYVVYGGPALPDVFELSALDGTNGFRMTGAEPVDRAGIAVSGAGDVDDDGYDDVIVGANNANPNGLNNGGIAYIVYGGPAVPATVAFSGLGSLGVQLDGEVGGDQFGIAVSRAGDVDQDGFDDVIVGAINNDGGGSNAGRAYLVYGGPSLANSINMTTLGSGGVKITGALANDRAGNAVAGGGDLNRDYFDDIVVAASNADPNGSNSGAVYILHGGPSLPANISLASLGAAGVQLNGAAANDVAGTAVAVAGNVDGDSPNMLDLIVGAWGADPGGKADAGAAYLVKGATHFLQAVGPVAEGGSLTYRNHGTPGKQYLMLGALSRFDTPVFATIGPWWLESPFFDLFIFSFDATGQHGLTIPIAAGSPSLVGLEVHLQSYQEQFAAEPVTSYVLTFTIE